MLDFIFSKYSDWSWATFFLYYLVSVIVVHLCKTGVQCDSYVDDHNSKWSSRGNICFFVSYIILVLLATVRSSSVGPDTWKYVEDFSGVSKGNIDLDLDGILGFYIVEPGYQYFMTFIRSITDNYHVLFFVLYSLLSISYLCFIRHFLYKGASTSFLKIFIVFYVANMSGMRSALATVPFLFSLIALDKKQYIKAITLSVVAIFCHYTMVYNLALVLGCIIINARPKLWTNKNIILFLAVTLTIAIVGAGTLRSLFAETKYSFYTENLGELSLTGSIFYAFYGVLLLICNNKVETGSKIDSLIKITGIFIITYPLTFVTGAYRIPNYYALPRLIMWCFFIQYFIPSIKKGMVSSLIIESMVFVYILFRFYQAALDGGFVYQI